MWPAISRMILRATLLALCLSPNLVMGQVQVTAASRAQLGRGTVVDSVARQGIAGSIVMATGPNGTVLVRTLANERGAYQITFPATATGIRVRHIGFRPRNVPVTRTSSGIIQVNVTLSRVQTMLDAVNVRANVGVRQERIARPRVAV